MKTFFLHVSEAFFKNKQKNLTPQPFELTDKPNTKPLPSVLKH